MKALWPPTVSALLLAASTLPGVGCGGGATSGQAAAPAPPPQGAPPPTERPGETAGSPFSDTVETYSALNRGINIIPHFSGETLKGCTVVSLSSGNATEFTADECLLLVDRAQRLPGPSCQVLVEYEALSVEPSLCDHVVLDGVPLPAADDSAQRAAANAKSVLKFYFDRFARRGLDDQGSDNVSVVHISRDYANAFFSPKPGIMVYGDGDGVSVRDLTYGLDIAGHEMTHGVAEFTAHLRYVEEAGAVGEGIADFFGESIEGTGNWVMGDSVVIGKRGIRDLARPAALNGIILDTSGRPIEVPYPAHLRDKAGPREGEPCSSSNDNCYVHFNSTIMSHALYRLAETVGQEHAEGIQYLALTQYYGPDTGFQGAADLALLACKQLYEAGTCAGVSTAFSEVGLVPQGG